MLLYQTLQDCPSLDIENQHTEALQETFQALLDLFQQLKGSSLPQTNPAAYEITEQIVMLAYTSK